MISLERGDGLKILTDALLQLSIRCSPPDRHQMCSHYRTHMAHTTEHVTKHIHHPERELTYNVVQLTCTQTDS
jgi:uncharacterized Zn finger protein